MVNWEKNLTCHILTNQKKATQTTANMLWIIIYYDIDENCKNLHRFRLAQTKFNLI